MRRRRGVVRPLTIALPRLPSHRSLSDVQSSSAVPSRLAATADIPALQLRANSCRENAADPKRLRARIGSCTSCRKASTAFAITACMITDHGGRIIDTAGDGILAEFSSVVNAAECAVAIHRTMAQRNTDVEESRRMRFRIGINLGDVVFDDARIYGDGVNIAARLEGIAEPGGICISRKVYEDITGKMQLAFVDLGEQQLKNIAQPVRV
jgi:Adenylate and Guanylate cyclase catalytic domain